MGPVASFQPRDKISWEEREKEGFALLPHSPHSWERSLTWSGWLPVVLVVDEWII